MLDPVATILGASISIAGKMLFMGEMVALYDRMKAAQKATGEKEAMLVARGEMGRTQVVAAAQDFSFMAGSMGMYVGNAIIAAAKEALRLKCPLILFSAAGGARMQEGILSLMQMPRSTVAVQMLRDAGLTVTGFARFKVGA